MSESIILDKEQGINPHLSFCTRCGEDNGEIILLGAKKQVYKCEHCKGEIIGGKPRDSKCPHCENLTTFKHSRDIAEGEKIPGGLCTKCIGEIEEEKKVVAEGGVYFRCKNCGSTGAIRKSDFADEIRKYCKTESPNPCGVEFDNTNCPVCTPQIISLEKQS